jgi:hypothetical protein
LHVPVLSRQVVLERPGVDLFCVACGPSVAVRTVPVLGLQELLILAFQLLVQHYPMHARALFGEPFRRAQVRAIDMGVVCHFSRLDEAGVEALTSPSVVPLMAVQEVTTVARQGHERRAFAIENMGHSAHQPGLSEVAQIALSRIERTAVMVT